MNTAPRMIERERPTEDPIVSAEGADRATLPEALTELPLPFKATLELAYRRGLPDSTISEVAGLEEAEMARQRERALEWLAGRTGSGGGPGEVEDGLRGLSPAGWSGELEQDGEPQALQQPVEGEPPEAQDPGEEDPSEEKEPRPFPVLPSAPTTSAGGRQGSARRLLTALALAAALVVAVILIVSIGTGDSSDSQPELASETSQPIPGEEGAGGETGGQAQEPPDPGGEEPAAPAEMVPLAGAEAAGGAMATLSDSSSRPQLELALEGFPDPDGEYRAWLYNSVIDSVPLGSTEAGDGAIRARLPDGWEDFSFVDVSIQQDGSEAHSGRSVARVATADLPVP